jgi:electron transfer flavoprotein alpha subunit
MATSRYRSQDEEKSIFVYLETSGASLAGVSLAGVSLELLSRGRHLADDSGWDLTGILCGHEVAPLAAEAIKYGADRVILADDPQLDPYITEAYSAVINEIILDLRPSVLLLGATPDGRDLAGRLAVRLRTGLNADCTQLSLDTDRGVLVCEVSGFGGGVLALIEMADHRPQMATVRPGVFEPCEYADAGPGTLIDWPVNLQAHDLRTQVVEKVIGESVDLTKSPLLVIGGRGMGDDFGLLWELAHELGGEVGGTRPPVDEGHLSRERQIGQTGMVCRPKIALVFGASGAFHFIVGIQDADLVIAINNDPEAPIFEHADYGIIADVKEIVPALISALRVEREASHA